MIESVELTKRRSPAELRDFVKWLKETVRADETERHIGMLKKGSYKEFLDEIVPLSAFAVLAYPNSYQIEPILGNQGYDALVFDETGHEVDRVELTVPHEGAAAAQDARLVVDRGFGAGSLGDPGDDFDALFERVLSTCRKKAQKDYSNCTLVVAIEPLTPFAGFEDRYERQVAALVSQMSEMQFRASRVFLLILPDRLETVHC